MKKRISILLATLALMASCNAKETVKQSTSETTKAVVEINQQEFAEKISDYTTGTWHMKSFEIEINYFKVEDESLSKHILDLVK